MNKFWKPLKTEYKWNHHGILQMKQIIITVLLAFVAIAGYGQSFTPVVRDIVSKKDVSIEINTFDSIPSEIDGGCCVFYKNPTTEHRKGFVMVNDLASTAYMMINHKLEKFFLTTNKKDVFLYSNRNFTLKVRISSKRGKAKSEFYKVKGILVVEDHSKNKQKLPFYGNCSW